MIFGLLHIHFLNIRNPLSYQYVKFSRNSNHFCHFWACLYCLIYFLVMDHTKCFSTCSQSVNLGLTLGIPRSWAKTSLFPSKESWDSLSQAFIDLETDLMLGPWLFSYERGWCGCLISRNILIPLLNQGCSGVSTELATCSVRTLSSSW